MKMHVILVEPAQYTLDLIKNVYYDAGITFLYSDSKAVGKETELDRKAYCCDKNSFFCNLKHFVSIGLNNKFIVFNGYTHWAFQLLFLLSLIKNIYIGIDSDTPYSEKTGIKKFIKAMYLTTIFKRKSILGLSGGNGAHKDLFLKYGMDKQRVFLMPMMIDNEKYYFKGNRSTNKELVFLYVGRLDYEKNVDMLVNAFINRFSDNEDAKLIIVGSGSCEEYLINKCQHVENIDFKGKLFGDALISCYHSANVFVLPSVFEPWGLVINEALCAGLAVICSSAVGAANDLVKTPNSGWVFETKNQSQLEELLVHCVAHRIEVEQKAQQGLAFMKNNWNYENYKENLTKIKEYVELH